MDMNTDKSWLAVEMVETNTLFRKKLEEMNNIPYDELDGEDICNIKNIYKTLFYIRSIHKDMLK